MVSMPSLLFFSRLQFCDEIGLHYSCHRYSVRYGLQPARPRTLNGTLLLSVVCLHGLESEYQVDLVKRGLHTEGGNKYVEGSKFSEQ